jgi:hypothetical protein
VYAHLLLVDGNGWSSRFNRLLMSGSVVLKTTIYPEWNSVRQTSNPNTIAQG